MLLQWEGSGKWRFQARWVKGREASAKGAHMVVSALVWINNNVLRG
tara:strand:- start:285 stop:422 length:138 start_codon:yes stop_codon:yes gene_type:complete